MEVGHGAVEVDRLAAELAGGSQVAAVQQHHAPGVERVPEQLGIGGVPGGPLNLVTHRKALLEAALLVQEHVGPHGRAGAPPSEVSGLPEPALRLGEAVERDAPVPAHVLAQRRDQQCVTHDERVRELSGERQRPLSVPARGAVERHVGQMRPTMPEP